MVADPDANASEYAPPASMDARVASRAFRLGFPEREYSKPYDMVSIEKIYGYKIFLTNLVLSDTVLLVRRTQRDCRDDSTSLLAGL